MVKQRLQSAVENSALKSLSDAFTRGFEHSALSRICVQVLEIASASRIYRWLTTEPEPAIIVIDLRKTHTIGPLLSVLDAFKPQDSRFWENSSLTSMAQSVQNILSGSKAVRLAIELLEPPESPENHEQRE
ncbi:hypothetical protein GCM10009067_21130 [Haloarcula sebkhae]|uniref:Uncharacterized protein n=1 Tax=Haloarcula sebkhae TaxID=932660 RepID=A0A830ER67_9EURY|nr:hypothetical protein GCM10009067_21130 [Haloarcula sebkhae]